MSKRQRKHELKFKSYANWNHISCEVAGCTKTGTYVEDIEDERKRICAHHLIKMVESKKLALA